MLLSDMYRIPWTKNDNPNGWIEVTTECQLDCSGCYRAESGDDIRDPVEQMRRLKADVDTLVAIRNIQTLSIAGGEPLLYAGLEELISYARSKRLATRLFTNAVLLDDATLASLTKAGLTEMIIHASLWQERLTPNTMAELLKLKAAYCDMFRANGRVRLGFIEPAMRRFWDQAPLLFEFYQRNSDIVSNVVFTTFKDAYGGPAGQHLPIEEVGETIERHYGTSPCAYIPKIHHPEKVAWLLNVALLRDGKVIGSLSGRDYGVAQEQHRKVTGRYLFTPEAEAIVTGLGAEPMSEEAEQFAELMRAIQKGVHHQVVSVVDSPQLLDDGRVDMCDSCPDAILYQGELLPKCILDKIKGGLEVHIAR